MLNRHYVHFSYTQKIFLLELLISKYDKLKDKAEKGRLIKLMFRLINSMESNNKLFWRKWSLDFFGIDLISDEVPVNYVEDIRQRIRVKKKESKSKSIA